MTFKKSLSAFALFSIEMFLVYKYRQPILQFFAFLSNESENFFDDIFIGIIASILFSALQFFNLILIEKILMYSKKSIIMVLQTSFNCTSQRLKNANDCMMRFVFSTTTKWGVYKSTTSPKIANTSEGVLACANAVSNGHQLTNDQKNELINILNKMIAELCDDGYKSYNQNIYTVHCTAMGLFAIKKCIDLELFDLSDDNEEKIRICLKKLLNNANDIGWGFENTYYQDKNYNRALSTIWALRALNIWGFSGNKKYEKTLMNFVGHSDGIIGFSDNSTAKSSTTALLYILSNEIENKKTKKVLSSYLKQNNIIRFLIKNLKKEIEVEEFVISIQNTEKLSWTHLSECLTLEALAYSLNNLNFFQIGLMFYYLKRALNKINGTLCYYTVESMNFNHNNPFFFPTTYLITSICNIISNMEREHL